MKRKLLKILIYTLLMIITVVYTYKIRVLVDDELFNYGFAKNILDGLIPYKDFNMIIPPLFAYITAFILKIFGKKLLIYHILTAFIIIGITYVSAKKIGKMSFIIYLLLLIYPYTGYNMFSLFLFFILLNFIILNQKSENKKTFYLEPIIISLIILTKHTLGLLVIPSLIYSKNRLKTFLIYIISFLILVLYLAINNNIFEFIDYTILGMFSFTNKNGTSINFLLIVEFLIIGYLIYKLKKTKSKEYFYVLMYQIVTFPIVNYVHFMISFIPFIYLIILNYKDKAYFKWFSSVITITFVATFTIFFIKDNKEYNSIHETKNFMEGRLVQTISNRNIDLIENYIEKYKGYKPYILSYMAYQIKLNLDYPINKYDLINNGNMGYNGSERYIKEIDKYCKKNKCIFFINTYEITEDGFQTNKDILKYVQNDYKRIYSSNILNIYTN